jgi:3-dehydroquinate synthase II
MKKIWVKVDPFDKDIVTTALEGGVDGIMVPKGYSKKVKELGIVDTISEDGDIKPGTDVINYTIKSGEDEDEILKLCQTKKVIVECTDWTIIPLENLIAKGADVITLVSNYDEANTAFTILEKGVNHILYDAKDALELKSALSKLRTNSEKTDLTEAEIISIETLGMGDRACVDTCTSMEPGEGMLTGNSSKALFLVHAETVSNPYVNPRPFRINAGAVHAYCRVPGGKTKYLSDLKSGDQIMITDFNGNSKVGIVGRLKIEKRPLMLIKAKTLNNEKDQTITTIVQNAETIRLTSSKGEPISVVSLKNGDKVLVAIEEHARHFGHKIDETITEK